jgi:hypothetical protein
MLNPSTSCLAIKHLLDFESPKTDGENCAHVRKVCARCGYTKKSARLQRVSKHATGILNVPLFLFLCFARNISSSNALGVAVFTPAL